VGGRLRRAELDRRQGNAQEPAAAHGMGGVAAQIEQHLIELGGVGEHPARMRRHADSIWTVAERGAQKRRASSTTKARSIGTRSLPPVWRLR